VAPCCVMLVRRPAWRGCGGGCDEPGRVVAFVVSADRATPPSVQDLDRTCLDRIARYKRPKDYRFVDALPTNNYGKVVKRELRDQLRAETAAPGPVHHSEETVS
jgi:acyl-CoA synthetase (AMP-forming)/AMP-acid ligase II